MSIPKQGRAVKELVRYCSTTVLFLCSHNPLLPLQSGTYISVTAPKPGGPETSTSNDADIDDNARDVHFVEPYPGT